MLNRRNFLFLHQILSKIIPELKIINNKNMKFDFSGFNLKLQTGQTSKLSRLLLLPS